MPPRFLGVWTTRAPAPMPTVLGVPGTLILAADDLTRCTSFASASRLEALRKVYSICCTP
jgi:hypothetical protein